MSLFDDETKERALAGRRAVQDSINFRSRAIRERRRPDQVPDKTTAIVGACRECQGYEPGAGEGTLAEVVRACPATACWLWPWRTGELDPSLKRGGGKP